MVIFVDYHIPQKTFKQYRKEFRKFIGKDDFQIAIMKFEKGMNTLEIAKFCNLEEKQVRETLSFVCKKIRKGGYEI